MKNNTPQVWVIRKKDTHDLFTAPSGKSSWRAAGHAKNAWATIRDRRYYGDEAKEYADKYNVALAPTKGYKGEIRYIFPRFDEQDVWEVVEWVDPIKTSTDEAITLLKLCLGRITDSYIEDKVKAFLEGK